MPTTAHIINHTHWDREWFLTSIYTSQWIAGLVDKVERLAAANPDFKFLLDGQTLIIEDLLALDPTYEAKVRRLVADGHLIIGPYYCQPDWQLTGGETLIRNLLYGRQDMQRLGAATDVGWLVDTFGHIAQAPQLHALFGLQAVYVWRGVPQMIPYFLWQGSDGQPLFTINLFGGYRNLYGITHAPAIAIKRLLVERDKLQPYYPTPDIPLFDGYDLEEDPEDPISFYRQHAADLPPDLHLEESAPHLFAQTIRARLDTLPTIAGELNSGKYGATFPGTFSARTYLKLMQHDCEHALYHQGEPLALLAHLKGRSYNADRYEDWTRLLLQNAVHDCICGVSIDLVHEKMEYGYRAVWQGLQRDIHTSLTYILRDFAPGTYAVSTNPAPYTGFHAAGDQLYPVQTDGVGVWPVAGPLPIEYPAEPATTFTWQNPHYAATVHPDGTIALGAARLGELVLLEEHGDTYSEEPGPQIARFQPDGPLIIEQRSPLHTLLRYGCQLAWNDVSVSATVRLHFDQTPLLRWQIDLDSQGTNFRVELRFHTAQPGRVYAGMPFDTIQRPTADTDLLPRLVTGDLASILLGQRELEAVHTFPFHDWVALSDGTTSAVIFAKGLRAYRADEEGTLSLPLRRSVEWLTAADLPHRIGDAGPFFYVPGARCQRSERHELAAYIGPATPNDLTFHQLSAGFQNPPLLVQVQGSGQQTEWPFLQENLPFSALHLHHGQPLARFYNPTNNAQPLSRAYHQTDVSGTPQGTLDHILPKKIVTLTLDLPAPETESHPLSPRHVTILTPPLWRVGPDHALPQPHLLDRLRQTITQLETCLSQLEQERQATAEDHPYRLEHASYVIERELYEFRLALRLNELKLATHGTPFEHYLFTPDPQITALGLQLNRLRIKRRIYDYIVAALQ